MPPAAKLVRPVPPCPTDKAVVRPLSEVMSLLAPIDAAARLALAPVAEVAPVPPLVTPRGELKVNPANVGAFPGPTACGSEIVTSPVIPLTCTPFPA